MAIKFLDEDGSGFVSDTIIALEYVLSMGVKISSNSWGASAGANNVVMLLQQALNVAKDQGHLFIAAAGNAGRDIDGTTNLPCASFTNQANMICVASTTKYDRMSSFSNYGVGQVDVAAPGSLIYSTVLGANYQQMSGTSMAAPFVSGLAALLAGFRPQLASDLMAVKTLIRENVDALPELSGKIATGGRINAHKAVQSAQKGFAGLFPPITGISTVSFTDTDSRVGRLAGSLTITFATRPADVEFVRVFFLNADNQRIKPTIPIQQPDFMRNWEGPYSISLLGAPGSDTAVQIPNDAAKLGVFCGNQTGVAVGGIRTL